MLAVDISDHISFEPSCGEPLEPPVVMRPLVGSISKVPAKNAGRSFAKSVMHTMGFIELPHKS